MKTWPLFFAGLLASVMLTSSVLAQVPAAPATPAAAAAAAPATPAGAAAAGGAASQGFPFCQKCAAQCTICSAWFCQTPIGQLFNNAMMPVSAISGGLLTSCCPTVPSAADLAAVADDPGPMGAAAAVAVDEANAKKRKAAVRYLSTADCHWWPEVEKALIIALRTDRNECVRLEAAIGLGKGCCCTRRVIEALAITVEGSSRDGNPSENSERVRTCALASLNHCLCCYRSPPEPVQAEDKEKAPPGLQNPTAQRLQPQPLPAGVQVSLAAFNGSTGLSPYYAMVERQPMAVVVTRARKVAEAASGSGPLAPHPTQTCIRDILFPWMATPETTVATRTITDASVVQAAATVVQPSTLQPSPTLVQTSGNLVQTSGAMPVQTVTPEMQTEYVPAQERPRMFPRLRTLGNSNSQPTTDGMPTTVPGSAEPVMLQPVPTQSVPVQPTSPVPTSQAPGRPVLDRMASLVRREPSSEPAATPNVAVAQTASVSVASAPVGKPPVVSAPVVPPHAVVVESKSKPAATAVVQAGHFEPSASNVDSADMMQGPGQNTVTHTVTPVPITDLVGPNSSAILRGEPVVEKKTVTVPAKLPAPMITTPAAAASLTPPAPPQMLPPPPAAAPKTLPAATAVPQTLPPVSSAPPAKVVVATSSPVPVSTPVTAPAPANGIFTRYTRTNDADAGKNDPAKLLHVVQTDGNPAVRRQAMSQLDSQNLQNCREAMPVLLNSACGDSDAEVRVRCIHCLLKLNPSEAQLRTVLDRLKGDTDQEVQFQLYLVHQRLEKPAQANKTSKG